MDFPAFSSICSSNKAECGVYAGWILCECQSFFCSSCRFVRGILCRWEDKEKKRQKVKGTKRRRDEESKRQRDEERKRRRDEKTKTASPPIHLLFTSYSPPIHLLFTSYSCPLHLLFTSQFVQFLFNSCPKTFVRFVSKTVLHQGTPFRERSVKVT